MNLLQLSGIIIVAAFGFVLAGSLALPPRLFPEPDASARLKIIDDYPARWIASNILFALCFLLTPAGFLLLSLALRGRASAWLLGPAAVAFLVGGATWTILIYRRTVNPKLFFDDYTTSVTSPLVLAGFWLTVAALVLYGVVFLQTDYPNWLGLAGILFAGLLAAAALLRRDSFFTNLPPQLIYLYTLVVGVVSLLR